MLEGDQESAYVLFMRYLDLVQTIRSSKEFKSNKVCIRERERDRETERERGRVREREGEGEGERGKENEGGRKVASLFVI